LNYHSSDQNAPNTKDKLLSGARWAHFERILHCNKTWLGPIELGENQNLF